VAVLDRALARDREARYASCHDLQADLDALLVSMGQTITQARISDFAKSYADPIAAPDENTGATMQALEAEMNGTGPVRPVPGRRVPGQPREPRTLVLPPPPARDRHGIAYGIAAFLSVAAVGGAGGYALLMRRGEPPTDPVPVERVAVVETAATPEKKEEPPQVQEKPRPAETEPPPAAVAADPGPAKTELPSQPPPPAPAAPTPAAPAAEPPAAVPPPQAAVPAAPKARPRRPPQPVPAAEPPVVTAKGELVLLIRPWAKVEVDGKDVGVTPLNEPLLLAAGEHTVRLVNPDLGKDITRTVRITASGREVLKELLDE
jgi:serine/threonine-protein kinase